jgi:hypothetical protein
MSCLTTSFTAAHSTINSFSAIKIDRKIAYCVKQWKAAHHEYYEKDTNEFSGRAFLACISHSNIGLTNTFVCMAIRKAIADY